MITEELHYINVVYYSSVMLFPDVPRLSSYALPSGSINDFPPPDLLLDLLLI